MSCDAPLRASRAVGSFGSLDFSQRPDVISKNQTFSLPCGKCAGCALDHSRDFMLRGLHELESHDESCFATFTYSSAPKCLQYRDFVLFAKRFRSYLWNVERKRVSILYCGEYGELNHRPHFHAIIFGWKPKDGVPISVKDGNVLFKSGLLSCYWDHGFSSFGAVTAASIRYVCAYMLKRVRSPVGEFSCPLTGEVFSYVPEKVVVPRGRSSGLGKRYFYGHREELLCDGKVVHDGQLVRAPKYYLRRFASEILDAFRFVDKVRGVRHRQTNPYVKDAVRLSRFKLYSKGKVL